MRSRWRFLVFSFICSGLNPFHTIFVQTRAELRNHQNVRWMDRKLALSMNQVRCVACEQLVDEDSETPPVNLIGKAGLDIRNPTNVNVQCTTYLQCLFTAENADCNSVARLPNHFGGDIPHQNPSLLPDAPWQNLSMRTLPLPMRNPNLSTGKRLMDSPQFIWTNIVFLESGMKDTLDYLPLVS